MDLAASPLIDSFGRVHNNLRISVTDRCNIRCVYCMPENAEFMPRSQLLTFEEIERFVRIAVPLGIDKIRLTGGEPLVRKDLPLLVEKLANVPGIRDVGLTTNGILLGPVARLLWDAGLRRINVSLDTLDPDRFRQLTRRPGLEQVVEGILAAKEAGFDPVKINAVAIKGMTEEDIVPLARFAREHGLELRFIEYMPLDGGLWEREKVLFAADILNRLTCEVAPLEPAPDPDPRAPAIDYDYIDGGGRVGLIASVSRPFCMSCNRIRLTSDGKLRNCLFSLEETDIKGMLRGNADDAEIAQAIRASVSTKWEGHEINTARFVQPGRLMHSIGG
jgi:cyclic pyranopterin phosphate synthase